MAKKDLIYADRAASIIGATGNAVGRIKKQYGDFDTGDKKGNGKENVIAGGLFVTLYDNFPESFLDETFYTTEPLWVEIDTLAVPLFIRAIRTQGASFSKAVICFDDFERAEDAELLIGKTLYAEHPDNDHDDDINNDRGNTHAFRALIGFELKDTATGRVGIVKEFYDYPKNPLLGVDFGPEYSSGEVLVPAADELFTKINPKSRKLEAALPEGLFDL